MKLFHNLSTAVVESLGEIFIGKRYADKVIEKVLRQNPKWGARDRRFIAEVTYDIVRWHRLYTYLLNCHEHDFWKLLAAWCVWNKIALPPWEEFENIDKVRFFERWDKAKQVTKIRESIPDWMDDLGQKELGGRWPAEIQALNETAQVVLRVNTLKVDRAGLLQQLAGEEIVASSPEEFPDALILEERQNIFTRPQFRDGLFEVQDAGSQLIAPFLKPEPGQRIIDACAGAGGKTLHLASLMKNKGRIIAMDTEGFKLDELKKRARRAGASNIIETRVIDSSKVIKRLEQSADRVLLDVPCSGLGVIRRNPDAKWKLTPEFIEEIKTVQQKILTEYSTMLKPGGRMVYSTCSILPSENEKQVDIFLNAQKGSFTLEETKHKMPSEGFDGFFMARLKKAK